MSERAGNEKKRRGSSLLTGAIILSVGGILSKIIGAFYRIPLTNILGSEGMGLYQLVFPYYIFLLAISTTGLPAAISGLISRQLKEGRRDLSEETFRVALLSLTVIGAAMSLAMFFCAPLLAKFLQAPGLAMSFRAISPAILFVCVISAFRGRFAGRNNMAPTAISQVLEQVFKAGFCLFFASLFMPDVGKAVLYSILSVTISEAAALLFLVLRLYLAKRKETRQDFAEAAEIAKSGLGTLPDAEVKENPPITKSDKWKLFRAIYAVSIPVTVAALLTPLAQIADGFLAMRIVSRYASGAGQYGLFSGPVCSLVSFPTVFAQSIGLALIPGISGKKDAQKEISLSLKLTFFIAVPCTVFFALYAMPVTKLLYGRLPAFEIAEIASLLRVYSLSILGVSLMQTCVSILIAKNRAKVCMSFMAIAAVVKVVLSAVLMSFPRVNIFGAAISGTICFLLAGTLDLVYIIRDKEIGFRFSGEVLTKPVLYSSAVAGVWLLTNFLPLSGLWKLALSGVLLLGIFGLLFFKGSMFREDLGKLMRRKKHDQDHRNGQ